jgi:uncharacterized flavoprotein (TIGR03862 family)
LQAAGIGTAALRPSNCGFDIGWSEHLALRHAGAPLKGVKLDFEGGDGRAFHRKGECVLTATGLEGSLVYAASALLRDEIEARGEAHITLDLLPERSQEDITAALARGRGARSFANHLREQTGLHGAKAGLLREDVEAAEWQALTHDAAAMASRIKALPLVLRAARPLEEAISSAGGVLLESLDEHLMLKGQAGVACAGEMLDWGAPTGGYLLTACFASGQVAAHGLLQWRAGRHA